MSKSRFSHAAMFGAAAAVCVIVLALIIYLLELHEATNYLSYAIAITLLCIGVKKWREQEGGYLSFGGAYKHLILQSLVYSLIMTVWTVIFSVYIAPGMMEDRMLMEQAKMEDKGLPQEQIEVAMSFLKWMSQPAVLAVLVLFGGMIMFALIDLILAAIMKKDPPADQFMPPGNYPNVPSPERFPNMPPANSPYGENPYGNNPPPNVPPQQ